MVETHKTFPKPEMLERFAKTLGIEPHQLFTVENDLNVSDERLHKKIVNEMKHMVIDIQQTVKETVRETIREECKYNKKILRNYSGFCVNRLSIFSCFLKNKGFLAITAGTLNAIFFELVLTRKKKNYINI